MPRALARSLAPFAAAALALTLGVVGPLAQQPGTLRFDVTRVDDGRFAMSPGLSYAPDGSLWYLGARTFLSDPPDDANLWWAPSDAAPFLRAPDPPTSGAGDAVVHHDLEGRMFVEELFPLRRAQDYVTEVGVRLAPGVWKVTRLPETLNRPAFATTASGETFIAGKHVGSDSIGIYRFDRRAPSSGDPMWGHGALLWGNTSGFADIVARGDSLHLLVRDAVGNGFLVASSSQPPKFGWTFTGSFLVERTNGIPKLAFGADETMYVVSSERLAGSWSVFLRRWDGATWAGPYDLCGANVTCTIVGAAGGSGGRLGVAWYEADGNVSATEAPKEVAWRFRYGLFENATGAPRLVAAQTLLAEAYRGHASSKSFTDYVTVLPRQADPAGKVVVAFACAATCQGAASPLPYFAVQVAGPGLRD